MELTWSAPEDRVYQTGLDRGVFASESQAEAWNGLVSVDIDQELDTEPSYFGGIPIHDLTTIGSVSATLKTYSTPNSFRPYGGKAKVRPGLFVAAQPPKRFNFCYRTLIGNGESDALGYKLHFIYNAIAQNSGYESKTTEQEIEPALDSWEITTAPSEVGAGYHPSSYLALDSRFINPINMAAVEARTYGDNTWSPWIWPIDQLIVIATQ